MKEKVINKQGRFNLVKFGFIRINNIIWIINSIAYRINIIWANFELNGWVKISVSKRFILNRTGMNFIHVNPTNRAKERERLTILTNEHTVETVFQDSVCVPCPTCKNAPISPLIGPQSPPKASQARSVGRCFSIWTALSVTTLYFNIQKELIFSFSFFISFLTVYL